MSTDPNDAKTIDQLCARDIGRRVSVTLHNGDTATGALRAVVQNTRDFSRFRFAVTGHPGIFEIQVGQFSLAGLNGRKEVRFL